MSFLRSSLLVFMVTGCGSAQLAWVESRHREDLARCTPRPTWPPSVPELLEPRLADEDQRALASLPPEIARVVRAGRLEAPLALVLRHRRSESPAALAARIELAEHMRSLSVELAAAQFEVDCTGDQVEAARKRLEQAESDHEGVLTVASIAVGAVAGVVSGVWDVAGTDSTGPAWFQIVGGTASAVLGIAALVPRSAEITVRHPRNLLAPIATGHDPDRLYGTFIWRLLGTSPPSADNDPPTLREQIFQHWRAALDESVRPAERAAKEALLFGSGGTYDTASLDLRDTLFDILENEIDGMHRELERLGRYLRRLDALTLDADEPPPSAPSAITHDREPTP